MNSGTKYRFAWDANKAQANRRKHGIEFAAAVTVFRDPLCVILHDHAHDSSEERWSTVGLMDNGTLVAVVHTIEESEIGEGAVRIISARKPTVHERREYESGEYSIREPAGIDEYKTARDFEMQEKYDFSKGERGKFKDAVFYVPVWLELDMVSHFRTRAEGSGIETAELLSEILRRHMGPSEASKETTAAP